MPSDTTTVGRHRAEPEVINGYDIEELARTLFDARTGMQPISDERWAARLSDPRFVQTNRRLFEDARREALDGDD